MKRTITAAVLAAATAVSGCATVVRGVDDTVKVHSTPTGAKVTTDAGPGCAATPCHIILPRRHPTRVHISKPGYKTASVTLTPQLSGEGAGVTVVGNALVGGVVGVAVDAGTGAMMDLMPNPIIITLARK